MKRSRRRRLNRHGGWIHDLDLSWIPTLLFVFALFIPAFVGCYCDSRHQHRRSITSPAPQPILHIDPSTGQLGIGPTSPTGGPVIPL